MVVLVAENVRAEDKMEKEKLDEIERRRKNWEETILKPAMARLGQKEASTKFYAPLDVKDHDFLENVGFPGEYPFTAGIYPTRVGGRPSIGGAQYGEVAPTLVRAGRYAGYGTAEDTRDYYKVMVSRGQEVGPNLAFDLPTQCGYDSDDPRAVGEVGMTGVAVSTLRDFEVIYEAFTGDMDLDKIATNWTINAPANVIIAMYVALAEKRGIPPSKLRGTPQNDILKEYVARGTYIFPPKHGMRMMRDSIVYCTKNMPLFNWTGCGAAHLRWAGGTGVQVAALSLCIGAAYVQLGINAGLNVDDLVLRMTFLQPIGGGREFFKEIALARAIRRMWAEMMRERFGTKNPRSWIMRASSWATKAEQYTTKQRPLNNLIRGVIGGVMSCLSGGTPANGLMMPYDEPLGLGHSEEGWQLNLDASRIIQYESKLTEVMDPLAGSYYVEALTDETEEEIWKVVKDIEVRGGIVAAIEQGYIHNMLARSAYGWQRGVENGENTIVGENEFTDKGEIEVITGRRLESHLYDVDKMATAEERQLDNLAKVKRERNNNEVQACLKRLKEAAQDDSANLMPSILDAVKAYASIGEICGALREVFGEYQSYGII